MSDTEDNKDTQTTEEQLVSAINQLATLVGKLSQDVEDVKSELRSVKSNSNTGPVLLDGDEQAVHHTIKRIESMKLNDHFSNRQKAEEALSNAADMAIIDYKKNPPKHRQ